MSSKPSETFDLLSLVKATEPGVLAKVFRARAAPADGKSRRVFIPKTPSNKERCDERNRFCAFVESAQAGKPILKMGDDDDIPAEIVDQLRTTSTAEETRLAAENFDARLGISAEAQPKDDE